jgi:hypothetical protein
MNGERNCNESYRNKADDTASKKKELAYTVRLLRPSNAIKYMKKTHNSTEVKRLRVCQASC